MKFRARDPLSALTHFIGFLAVIPPVICLLERSETTAQVVSFAIFGISLLLLYGASTIYHTLCLAPEKIAFLRRIDHMMIFVLIAGTYTPVCMVILPGIWGKALLAAVWGIAIFGIFMKIFWMNGTALALYADLCRHGLACGCGIYSVEKSHRLGRTGDASGRRHCVYHRCGDLCAEKA